MLRNLTGRGRFVAGLVSACALVAVFAGCGAAPVVPPTAQQIFTGAQQSKMKDASIALSGSLTASSNGTTLTLAISGNGQLVVKPAQAYHMTLNIAMTSAQVNGTITGDLIDVGGNQYSKMNLQISGVPTTPTTLYTKTPDTPGDSSLFPSAGANLKIVGEETIRGDKCWHLTSTQYVDSQGTPVPTTTAGATPVTTDEWIRESDYYYVRVTLSTLPGLGLPLSGDSGSSSGASANTGFTIDLSNYDTGATIAPPPADQIQS